MASFLLLTGLATLAGRDAKDDVPRFLNMKAAFDFSSLMHLHGHFVPDEAVGFARVDSSYCHKEMYLIDEVYNSFLLMAEAAAADGLKLRIVSATRTFDYQKSLWENKWTGKTRVDGQKLNETHQDELYRALKVMEYTAPPGFSRHHWGTEIDVNSVEDEYFLTEEGNQVYLWLQQHAAEYGFCQTYTALDRRDGRGFNEEKWHWSYQKLSALLLEEMIRRFDVRNVAGFMGFEEVRKIDLLNDYLLAINTCR